MGCEFEEFDMMINCRIIHPWREVKQPKETDFLTELKRSVE